MINKVKDVMTIMMSGKEKIYFLLNRIDDAKTITPAGQPLIIDPTNNLNQNYRDIELTQLFTKLARDEQILKILKAPSRTKEIDIVEDVDPYDYADDGCWHIELFPAFDNYFLKIQEELEYQEYSGRKPTGNPAKVKGNNLMTYEEKLDLVVKAVLEASKTFRKGAFTTTLYLDATNGLDRLLREEIHNILLQLQDEKALKVHPLNNRLLPSNQQPTHYLLLDIPNFDSWYGEHLIANKSKLENLSEQNLKNIIHIMHLIELELELDQSEKITIGFGSSVHDIEGNEKEYIDEIINTYARGLGYLKNIGVIKNYTTSDITLSSEVTLNIAKFFEILEKIKGFEHKKTTPQIQTHSASKKQIVDKQKISYNKQQGVLEIEGKKVKFDKESFRAKLLELLLKDDKNIKKEWSWDEVLEEIEGVKDADILKENKKKFYPACDGLSKLIAQKTGINNLLNFNKSTVQINPKYH